MSYREYQRMMGFQLPDVSGPGITFEDFSVDEVGEVWYATLYFKDGAPLLLHLYVWGGPLEAVWKRIGHVPDEVEPRGNGHFAAAWRRSA